jgi:hypothetical protein
MFNLLFNTNVPFLKFSGNCEYLTIFESPNSKIYPATHEKNSQTQTVRF